MHKIEEITVPAFKHIFYCDKCGKKIMEDIECDDGYYREPSHQIIKDMDYSTPLDLCNECKDKIRMELTKGFKEIDRILGKE